MRIIMLVDMDYFFAACEELRKPEIKGKPVIVGADPKGGNGRGVVSTCNYVARRYGIRSGMPISMAYRLKKDAVFLPVDDKYYEKISNEIMRILRGFAGRFEQVSIDEAFMDVSEKVDNFDKAVDYAREVKEAIMKGTGLKCSIGISENKLLAKMACEAAKPDGIKVLKREDVQKFIEPMPVDRLYGVGKKTAQKLKEMGYETVGELSKAGLMELVSKFGVYGKEIYDYARGIDESEVVENNEIKSIGRERTFDADTDNIEEMKSMLETMANEIKEEIDTKGLQFKTVTIKIRKPDFTEFMKSRSLSHYSNSDKEMLDEAFKLLADNIGTKEKVRKIGLRVSGLASYRGQRKLAEYM
ncbi:MAG: DNA polymerase IV [Candidatus Micrarchaeia archaeon]